MADTEEKTSAAKPPVYILGNTPLGQFLAAKFILNGRKCGYNRTQTKLSDGN